MWLFTRYGFYSAVCARQGNGKHGTPVDPTRIMVRARKRQHLVTLQERFRTRLDACEIMDFVGSDYPFRLFVDKAVWSEVVTELTTELDYDNFKSEVARFLGKEGADYGDALHKVWAVMKRLPK